MKDETINGIKFSGDMNTQALWGPLMLAPLWQECSEDHGSPKGTQPLPWETVELLQVAGRLNLHGNGDKPRPFQVSKTPK